MKCHSKKFVFPKVAFCSSRKVNQPEIEMELRYTEKGPELSICGSIWNSKHTDIVMGGQCLDELAQFDSLLCDPLFKKLYKLWKAYHLNSLRAGSRSQRDALIAEFGTVPDYDKACEYLKSIDLYKDENDYIYGSSWLYEAIPDEDMNEIKALLEVA